MMKKSFLILLLLATFACKKKSDDSTTATLSGKWSTGGYDIILYNSSGEVVRHSVADAIKSYWNFTDTEIQFSNVANSQTSSSTYRVKQSSKGRQLIIDNPSMTGNTTWRIETETANQMQISAEITDAASLRYGNNQVAAVGKKFIYLSKE